MKGISRRSVLEIASLTLSISIAGCSSLELFGCADHNAAVIRTEAEHTQIDTGNMINFSGLSTKQQEFVEEAITSGEYRVCPYSRAENSKHIREFAYAVENHRDETSNTAYIKYDGQYYSLYVRIEDQMFATT